MTGVIRRLVALLLFLVLSPALIVIAILIRIHSPGPILFRQVRIGRGQQPFIIYKFRTMYDRSWPVQDVSDGDPRVVPATRWLRKTHLDELPQLWNIACGEMAFIGPRPLSPELVEVYLSRHYRYKNRFQLLPGMTGFSQMKMERGYYKDFHKSLVYDEQYRLCRNWFMDLQIVVRTLMLMMKRRGR